MTIIERGYGDGIVIDSLGVLIKVVRKSSGKVNLVVYAPDAVRVRRGEVQVAPNVVAVPVVREIGRVPGLETTLQANQ